MIQKFTIKGDIKTKQRPRATVMGGHARVYTPKDTIFYENYVRSEYQRQCDDYHFGSCPLRVQLTAYFKPSQELAKHDFTKIACCNQKDLDNIAKTCLDSLNSIAYDDDRQIIELSCMKLYDKEERIEITIESLDKHFYTLDQLKAKEKMNQILAKYDELKNKEKLTSVEKKRFADIKEKLGI